MCLIKLKRLCQVLHAIIKDGLIMYKGKKRDILTDEILSDVFGIDVSVVWEKNRPWIIVK